jgi:hypothetical protein
MSPRVLAVLFALLILVPVATPVVGASVAAGPTAATQETPTEPATENTTFYLQVRPNGNVQWTITDTYVLEDANDTRAFENIAQAYVDGETDTGWIETFTRASVAASEATGRQMNVTDVRRDYVVSDGTGTLVLEFTWTNFATVEGDRVVVGDAFNTTDGTWLRSLTEEQRLVISPPAGYGVRSVPTAVEGGELRFDGPRTFEPGYLRIVYAGEAPETRTTTPPQDGGVFGGSSLWLGGAAVLILGLVVAVGYMARQGTVGAGGVAENDDADGGQPGTAAETERDDAEESEEVDVELLSDEERVERLLEQNGGRMKQAQIVKETGWSNAKVSQLLSAMDDDDRVDKLRIGRENLISFPDEDIGDFEE